MEETKDLYYEAPVQFGDELKTVFEAAVERNAKYYRGVSDKGKYYGWAGNKYVKAAEGQEWFENPHYKPPVTEPVQDEQPIPEDLPQESAEHVDTIKNISEPVMSAFDYEAKIAELEKALTDKDALLDEKTKLLAVHKENMEELKNAVKVIIDFIKGV